MMELLENLLNLVESNWQYGDFIRLKPDADVSLGYEEGEPPQKYIKDEGLWAVDGYEKESGMLNISRVLDPYPGAYCSWVPENAVTELVSTRADRKEKYYKKERVKESLVSLDEIVVQGFKKSPATLEREILKILQRILKSRTDTKPGDVIIKSVRIIGSRLKGVAKPDSDLDVLVTYKGTDSEELAFWALHPPTPPFYSKINGIKIDVTPKRIGVKESTIDFPQPSLDTAIWDKMGDSYKMKPNVKKIVLDTLKKYTKINLIDIADEIHITGSIGTNQYTTDADLDCHIVTSENKINNAAEVQGEVFKFFRQEGNIVYVDKHPIEVYLQFNANQELLAEDVYDLLNDECIIGSHIIT